jgi:hypothetical protein
MRKRETDRKGEGEEGRKESVWEGGRENERVRVRENR